MTHPDLALVVAAGVLGLAIGSFLNVCIYRLPRGESILWPASHCPACGGAIAWYHNVPLAGWIALRGRCARCGAAISPMYPIVEATTAVLFAAHAAAIGWDPLLVVRLVFVAALIVLFVTDLQHQILPNVITLPGIVFGLAASVFLAPGWRDALIGVLVGGGVLWGTAELYFRLRGVEGLGMGDVKMLAMIGAFLGWKLALATLFFSSIAGALVGIALVVRRGETMQLKIPFGTFLAAGALAAGLAGQPLVDWYVALYR